MSETSSENMDLVEDLASLTELWWPSKTATSYQLPVTETQPSSVQQPSALEQHMTATNIKQPAAVHTQVVSDKQGVGGAGTRVHLAKESGRR